MTALPGTTHSLTVPLNWTGNDGAGSGVASYDVYVSDNNGPFTLYLDDTPNTSAKFHGEDGHTYRFAVVATDHVGYVEAGALIAEATTLVDVEIINFDIRTPLKFIDSSGDQVTVTLKGAGTGQAILTNGLTSGGDLDTLTLAGTTNKSTLTITVKKVGASGGTTTLGHIFANGPGQSLKSITATQAFLAPDADDPGLAIDVTGTLGPVKFAGLTNARIEAGTLTSLTTGAIKNVTIDIAGAAGNITAKLTKQVAPVNVIDGLTLTAASIGKISASVAGLVGLTQASAITDSTFTARTGSIGAVTASVTTPASMFDLSAIEASHFSAALGMGKISGTAKSTSRTPVLGSTAVAMDNSSVLAGSAQPILTKRDLPKAGLPGLSFIGAVRESTIAVKGSIGAISVSGDLVDSTIVAGVDLGADGLLLTADDTYHRHASIASVKVSGRLMATSIIAGIDPGDDFTWGRGTGADADVLGAAIAGLANGKIGAITLGIATITTGNTTPFRTPSALAHDFAIEAQTLATIQIGKLRGPKPLPTSLWVDADGDGNEDTDEILVRRF